MRLQLTDLKLLNLIQAMGRKVGMMFYFLSLTCYGIISASSVTQ